MSQALAFSSELDKQLSRWVGAIPVLVPLGCILCTVAHLSFSLVTQSVKSAFPGGSVGTR